MLTPKEAHVLSKCVDRETGARLVPHVRQRQVDMRQVDKGVLNRWRRAEERVHTRLGWVNFLGNGQYSFTFESSAQYSQRKHGSNNFTGGWAGEITLKDGKLVGGSCNCPDEKAPFRGFRLCYHMLMAWLKVQAGDVMHAERGGLHEQVGKEASS